MSISRRSVLAGTAAIAATTTAANSKIAAALPIEKEATITWFIDQPGRGFITFDDDRRSRIIPAGAVCPERDRDELARCRIKYGYETQEMREIAFRGLLREIHRGLINGTL